MNRVCLIGRLTRDPELKYSGEGTAICNFSIAVDRQYKDKAGNKQADFFRITAWRKTAEFVGNYGSKGRLVAVDGKLQSRSYDKDGQKISVVEVVADDVNFLDKPKEGQQPVNDMAGEQIDDSDLPF